MVAANPAPISPNTLTPAPNRSGAGMTGVAGFKGRKLQQNFSGNLAAARAVS